MSGATLAHCGPSGGNVNTKRTLVLTVIAMLATVVMAVPSSAQLSCGELAATVSVADPTTDIVGTDGADVIVVTMTEPPQSVVSIDVGAGNDAVCINWLGEDAPVDLGQIAGEIRIMAGDGDDIVHIEGTPFASAFGEAGDDTLSSDRAATAPFGLRGVQRLSGGPGADTINAGSYVDVDGNEGNDLITAEMSAELDINAGFGADDVTVTTGSALQVFAGPGDDVVTAIDVRGSFIFGGTGNDMLEVTGGSAHNLRGDGGDDQLHGGAADDFMQGGDGNDEIRGGDGADRLFGNDGADQVYGEAGADVINGGIGKDALYGGWGDDNITGGLGDDEIYGSIGNDELFGSIGRDTIYGGPGLDLLAATIAPSNYPTLETAPLADVGGSRLFGGPGNDSLVGSNRWDRMQGGPGNDSLYGFEGRDFLRGGSGNDSLVGGGGIDDMNGNLGNDTLFLFGADVATGGVGLDDCVFTPGQPFGQPTSCRLRPATA